MVESIHEETASFLKNLWTKVINKAKFKDNPWVTKDSYAIRNGAIIKVLNAITSKCAQKDDKKFTIHFMKKDDTKWFNCNLFKKLEIKGGVLCYQGFWKQAYQECKKTFR